MRFSLHNHTTYFFVFAVLLIASIGCGPSVMIQSNRNTSYSGKLEPLHVLVHQGGIDIFYANELKKALDQEFAKRQIDATVVVLTGLEMNADKLFVDMAEKSKGFLSIKPGGGTSYYGKLKQVIYNLELYAISLDKPPGGDAEPGATQGKASPPPPAETAKSDEPREREGTPQQTGSAETNTTSDVQGSPEEQQSTDGQDAPAEQDESQGEAQGEPQGESQEETDIYVQLVWKARVDTNSGAYDAQIIGRMKLTAEKLIARLIEENLL